MKDILYNPLKCQLVAMLIKSLKFVGEVADRLYTMAVQNLLIRNLLRIITPEEIADIATKHNGGKFLSLTDLVNERVERKIYRDFTSSDAVDEIHEEHTKQNNEKDGTAKILPFKNVDHTDLRPSEEGKKGPGFVFQAIRTSQVAPPAEEFVSLQEKSPVVEHKEDENMSSFILVEKSRLKHSQKSLKQKEIINLYQKNSNIDVEHIKTTNQDPGASTEAGVLVNKKQY